MMDDKLKYMMKAMELTSSSEGMKTRILSRIVSGDGMILNPIARFAFSNPVRAAGFIAIAVTGFIWVAFGGNYPALLTLLISAR